MPSAVRLRIVSLSLFALAITLGCSTETDGDERVMQMPDQMLGIDLGTLDGATEIDMAARDAAAPQIDSAPEPDGMPPVEPDAMLPDMNVDGAVARDGMAADARVDDSGLDAGVSIDEGLEPDAASDGGPDMDGDLDAAIMADAAPDSALSDDATFDAAFAPDMNALPDDATLDAAFILDMNVAPDAAEMIDMAIWVDAAPPLDPFVVEACPEADPECAANALCSARDDGNRCECPTGLVGDGSQCVECPSGARNRFSQPWTTQRSALFPREALDLSFPYAEAKVDWDGDGLEDWAVLAEVDGGRDRFATCGRLANCVALMVYRRNAEGLFEEVFVRGFRGLDHFSGLSANRLHIYDIDLDGDLDLLVDGSGLDLYLQNPDGEFESTDTELPNTSNFPEVVADFNQDGRLDVLVLGARNRVRVHFGDVDQNFDRFSNLVALVNRGSTHSARFVAHDFDGDGDLDIGGTSVGISLGGGQYPLELWYFENDGMGNFMARDLAEGQPQISVRATTAVHAHAGDFDRDGRPDLLINHGTQMLMLYSGEAGFLSERRILSDFIRSADQVDVLDVNGDGHLDITRDAADLRSVYLGDGQGAFGPAISLAESRASVFLASANGQEQEIVGLQTNGVNWQLERRRLTPDAFQNRHIRLSEESSSDNSSNYRLADMDGDGRPELLRHTSRNNGRGFISSFLGDGRATLIYEGSMRADAVGDLNGDRRAEMLQLDDQVVWARTWTGDGLSERRQISVLPDTTVSLLPPEDVDGDGDIDLVVHTRTRLGIARNRDEFQWLENLGDYTFSEIRALAIGRPEGAQMLVFKGWSDVDGNGLLDVSVRADLGQGIKNYWYRSLGGGNFELGERLTMGDEAAYIQVRWVDVDADGDADLVAPPPGETTQVVTRLRRADGTLGEALISDLQESAAPNASKGLLLSDLDGDGHIDLQYDGVIAFGDGQGRFSDAYVILKGADGSAITFIDLDGDTTPDLLSAVSWGNVGDRRLYGHINEPICSEADQDQ